MNEHNSRRNFLKTNGLAISAGFLSTSILAKNQKMEDVIIGHNTDKYRVKMGSGVLNAENIPVNDYHEMVEDAKGRLIICMNEPKNNITTYKDGKLQRQHKQDSNSVFMHSHGVYVDSNENMYVPQWNSKNTYSLKLERVS